MSKQTVVLPDQIVRDIQQIAMDRNQPVLGSVQKALARGAELVLAELRSSTTEHASVPVPKPVLEMEQSSTSKEILATEHLPYSGSPGFQRKVKRAAEERGWNVQTLLENAVSHYIATRRVPTRRLVEEQAWPEVEELLAVAYELAAARHAVKLIAGTDQGIEDLDRETAQVERHQAKGRGGRAKKRNGAG